MIIGVSFLILVLVFLFVLGIRVKDLPDPEPISPFHHLDERRARIYEGLRDLQFEYRLGKLSDEDYQRTKIDLQKDLAVVMAEIDRLGGKAVPKAAAAPQQPVPNKCPHCGTQFPAPMKFCGQCGKPMEAATA